MRFVNIQIVITYSHCGQNATELLLLCYLFNIKDLMLLTFKWSEEWLWIKLKTENVKLKKLIEKGKPQKDIPTILKFKKKIFLFSSLSGNSILFSFPILYVTHEYTHFFFANVPVVSSIEHVKMPFICSLAYVHHWLYCIKTPKTRADRENGK